MSITWLELHDNLVAFSWEHFDGSILGVRLGHRDSVHAFNGQPNEWDVLEDNIEPEERSMFVLHDFNLDMYNAFALFPFEDEHLRNSGELYSQSDEIIMGPLSTGNYKMQGYLCNIQRYYI